MSELLSEENSKTVGIREYIPKTVVKSEFLRAIRKALLRKASRITP